MSVSVCGTDIAPGFIGIQGLGPGAASGAVPFSPGADVLAEVGATYVAIGSSCDFWAYRGLGPRGIPDGVLYQGRLTAAVASYSLMARY